MYLYSCTTLLFYGACVSNVICVGVSRELKERMKRFGNVNWSALVRCFIVEAVSCFEVEELLSKIERGLEYVPELSVEMVFKWIRADRNSH
jgi:hypothetical protein